VIIGHRLALTYLPVDSYTGVFLAYLKLSFDTMHSSTVTHVTFRICEWNAGCRINRNNLEIWHNPYFNDICVR